MNKDQAEALLVALGSKSAGMNDKWVRGACPLAPWSHKSGKDTNPSFGLFVSPGEPGRFHCFSCESGSLSLLLQTIEFREQQHPGSFHGNLSAARQIVEQEEVDLPTLPGYSEFMAPETKLFEELPQHFLDSFDHAHEVARARAFIEHRGYTLAEAGHFDLRYDAKKDMLLFPYRDVFGRLAGIRGRAISLPGDSFTKSVGHHDYVWNGVNNSALTWYGEECLNYAGPVVVVEGQFDRMAVSRVFPRVLANLTAKPVVAKVKKLAEAEGVILMLDGDETGYLAVTKFAEAFDHYGINYLPILLPRQDEAGNEIKTDPDKLGSEWIKTQLQAVGVLS